MEKPTDPAVQDRLDELNVLLKLAGTGIRIGYQARTKPHTDWRRLIPVQSDTKVSVKPWGVWSTTGKSKGYRLASFQRFDQLEANIREKMDL